MPGAILTRQWQSNGELALSQESLLIGAKQWPLHVAQHVK